MIPEKKTKVVCTIGPATSSVDMLSRMLTAGMNVMRLNFSHGDFAEHQEKVDNLRKAEAKTGIKAAIMQDLGGPKIRIGNFTTESITLKEGAFFTLTTEDIIGDETKVSVNYKALPKELKVGDPVLLHDGKKRLEVVSIKGNELKCKVIVGGEMKGRRGINLPGAHLSISSITEKDKKDLEFGIKNKVDLVAFSFVRRADDIRLLREMITKAKLNAKIIAKVEDTEGLENIEQIIELCDGVMVARGDLAIEIGAENVPLVQKMIIEKCNKLGKPVITATQMLESMIKLPVPTRAEVSDIANAIIDGTDAIMLSEESSLGQFPVECVETMTRVALKVEREYMRPHPVVGNHPKAIVDSVSTAALTIANDVGVKYIVALTESGTTARMISRFKPRQIILGFTPNTKTAAQLQLTYGCHPVVTEKVAGITAATQAIREYLIKNKLAKKGDSYLLLAGLPLGKKAPTNTLSVETI